MFEKQREYECHACHARLAVERKPGRRDDCPHCGAELHTCLNCALFDPQLTRGCRESQADEVRDKSRANFCGWFEFRSAGAPREVGDAARAEAAAFFGGAVEKGPNPMAGLLKAEREEKPLAGFFEPQRKDPEAERARAEAAFDGLFGKK